MNDISASDLEQLRACKRELRETNELMERAIAGINAIWAYLDRDFTFIRVSESYAAVDRHSPDYFVGKNHFALYPNPENEALFRDAVRTGERYVAIEKPFIYAGHPERGVTYWDWNLQPVHRGGRVEGVILTLIDVTEKVKAKHRAERAVRLAHALMETSLDPLLSIGVDGAISDVNEATARMTGIPRAQLIGTDFNSYFVDPARARAAYEQALREGAARDHLLEIRHVDGHVTPVVYNASVYRDESGEVAAVFAAARDMRARRLPQ